MAKVNLSDIIAPSFVDVHKSIKAGEFTHYWLGGGRGSTKSSFVSIQIVLGIMQDPLAHAVCFRKYGCDLRESVYNQIIWAIQTLGVQDYFTYTVSPMAITYKPTGQRIVFKGLDDPTKRKSQKMPFGFYKFAWFEELEQYAGMREIRSVTQSYMRGGHGFRYFYSFNPPQMKSNWVNAEAETIHDGRMIHRSTYLTVPREWLGEEFFIEAELLKKKDELAYNHEYLGVVTGTGGLIFPRVKELEVSDEMVATFDNRRKGLDWGFAVDPFAYIDMYYDKTRRELYIFDEIYKTGLLNDAAIEMIKARGIGKERIVADSAEPKSIAEFRKEGLNVKGARKGKDSVAYGIKWLQKLRAIHIDKRRCPHAWAEFSLYEHEKDKTGEFKSTYPDRNNHLIDAARYALEDDMRSTNSGFVMY